MDIQKGYHKNLWYHSYIVVQAYQTKLVLPLNYRTGSVLKAKLLWFIKILDHEFFIKFLTICVKIG